MAKIESYASMKTRAKRLVDCCEKEWLAAILGASRSVCAAAKAAGMHRTGLYAMCARHGLLPRNLVGKDAGK